MIKPDGSILDAVAYKEWLLRRAAETRSEDEAFLLIDLQQLNVTEGSHVQITL